jgi:DNA-binding NtrC family response regulator
VAEKKFREDLFYRLNVVEIHIPPLRERPDDLPVLIQHLIEQSSQPSQARCLSAGALRILLNYPWPGNVRELKNVVDRALILCRGHEITEADLPPHMTMQKFPVSSLQAAFLSRRSLAELEQEYILLGMELTGGNKKEVADILGIDRKTLYRKLDEYKGTE